MNHFTRATVMVEFAIVLPILVLLTFGLVFGGRIVKERMWARQAAYTTVLNGGRSIQPDATPTMSAWSNNFVTWANKTPSSVSFTNSINTTNDTVASEFSYGLPAVSGFYASTVTERITGPSLTSQFGSDASFTIGGGFTSVTALAVPYYDCSATVIVPSGGCSTDTENNESVAGCDVRTSPCNNLSSQFIQY